MKISPRTKEILKILCEQDVYITIDNISQKLEVSSRTVLRELKLVEKWLDTNGFALEKKKGTGIMLDVKKNSKVQIIELISAQKTKKYYSSEERLAIILRELLLKQEVLKTMYFNILFNVTDGTISSDLDKAEKWIAQYALKLIRRPGLGVYIIGEEKDKRSAIADLVYEKISANQIMSFIRVNNSSFQSEIWEFIDKDITDTLSKFLDEAQLLLGYQPADDAYSALAIHLAIALQRIRSEKLVSLETEFIKELQENPEYDIAKRLLQKVAHGLNIDIPKIEIAYIAMYLKGCKGRVVQSSIEGFASEDIKLTKLVKKMIQVAQLESGCYMEENEKLLLGLVRHLGTAISRIKMKMNIRNPLLKEIKSHYGDLYKIAQKCVEVINEYENITVPDSEIAYIAMHIGAVMERSKSKQSTYNVAVACTNGIGISRILSSRLEKEFKNLTIIEIISTINPDESTLREKGVDFIVSTIPIPYCELPVVVVNPLLRAEDKAKLEGFIKSTFIEIKKKKNFPNMSIKVKDRLKALNMCNQRIMEILENYELIQNTKVKNVGELINFVSQRIHKDLESIKQLAVDLKRRELQGSVLLEQKGIMLLHCRTNTVQDIYFKIIRLENGLSVKGSYGNTESIRFVVLMLAPIEVPKIAVMVLSEITRALVENEDFVLSIKEGSQDKVYNNLSFILYQFYQSMGKQL